jgi:hypothetical protein
MAHHLRFQQLLDDTTHERTQKIHLLGYHRFDFPCSSANSLGHGSISVGWFFSVPNCLPDLLFAEPSAHYHSLRNPRERSFLIDNNFPKLT